MEDVQQSVVETPVDAGETETHEETQVQSNDSSETVVTPAVDAQDAKAVREAMLKEMERRDAKTKEKFEQEKREEAQRARDALIAEQNYVHPITGQPVRTEAEYRQALRDQQMFESYQKEGYSDEAIQKIIAVEKSQEEIKAKLSEYESKSRNEQEFKAFLEAYPDAKADEIPATVWAEFESGKSLVGAYAKHENQLLKQRLAAIEQQKQIEQQNQANAQSSTGSVTGNGTNVPTFFTKKQVDGMSPSEVNKHYDAIVKSMQNPKFYE